MKLISFAFAATLAALSTVAIADVPKLIKRVPPEFPQEAVRKNVNAGTVTAKMHIATDGTVESVEIVQAEPKRVFDRAVSEALKEWRFSPANEKQTYETRLVFRNED